MISFAEQVTTNFNWFLGTGAEGGEECLFVAFIKHLERLNLIKHRPEGNVGMIIRSGQSEHTPLVLELAGTQLCLVHFHVSPGLGPIYQERWGQEPRLLTNTDR